jgi:hypothetical protein
MNSKRAAPSFFPHPRWRLHKSLVSKPVRRDDNRRGTNAEQTCTVAVLAMKRGPSVNFFGYWQHHKQAA